MFLLNWLRQFYAIRSEYPKPTKVCESCETLKMQLAIANDEKERLLSRLLEKPALEPKIDTDNLRPILPRASTPWRVKQQMMEQESRHEAQLRRNNEEAAIKPGTTTAVPESTEALENQVVGTQGA
jgi:hypothetical protein